MPPFDSPHPNSNQIGGRPYTSVVADGEPASERQRAMRDLDAALPTLDAFANQDTRLTGLSLTPDFHPGKPVPVGVVAEVEGAILPHLVGNDVGCGMRLLVLDGLTADDIRQAETLEHHLRHVLFQGGRNVVLRGRDRYAILTGGLPELADALRRQKPDGLLANLDLDVFEAELDRTSDAGVFATHGLDPDFAEFADLDSGPSRDAIFGSLGGGNHFLELGQVDSIVDGAFAWAAGMKPGQATLCVHSGSLDFGHRIASTVTERLRERRDVDDARILPLGSDLAKRYANGLANAANAAFANRWLLGLMAIEALKRATGRDVHARLVYDAPHNMAWSDGHSVTHRKGACPARGQDAMAGTPYAHLGEPVILPGSMGDATWLLKGQGASHSLASSAHGAGRRLSRGAARREAEVPERLRLVGPIDLKDPMIRGRSDILSEATARLNEEAPNAYRPIESIVTPMEQAGLVSRVARILPLITAKG